MFGTLQMFLNLDNVLNLIIFSDLSCMIKSVHEICPHFSILFI
jgi:hypothetical protein